MSSTVSAHSAQFRTLGQLRGGEESQAFDVSANGSVVVGTATDANFISRAVRWTPTNGLTIVAAPGGREAEGFAVSDDGNVIVGTVRDAQENQRAFRWTAASSTTFPPLTGESFAVGVSENGATVVGWFFDPTGTEQPFRWVQGGSAPNPYTFGDLRGFAADVNRDGTVVVGAALGSQQTLRAFRWTQEGARLELLSGLAPGFSGAVAITPDARFIVGNDSAGAFRWSTGGVVRIPAPPRMTDSSIWGISADGSRIVGNAETDEFSVATVWTEATGTVDLNRAFDVAIPDGWFLTEATAISSDGNWIVGNAENFEGARQGFILEAREIIAPLPDFSFETSFASVGESDGVVRLRVSHTGSTAGTVSVNFQTEAQSATAGQDFVGTNGVLTFSPGEREKEITIQLINDARGEDEETFAVRLSNPSAGMSVLNGMASVSIMDNEHGYEAPFFVSVSEAEPFVEVRIARLGDYDTDSSIDVITEGASAIAGVDFVAATNTVRFSAGQNVASTRVTLLNDNVADGTKYLNLRFTNAVGGIPAPQLSPMIAIEDNELGFSLGDHPSVVEGAGSVLNVFRLGDYNTSSQVRVTLMHSLNGQNGTAEPGVDYNLFTNTVTFAAGQTNVAVSVPVLDDHLFEGDETLFVKLESLSDVPAPEEPVLLLLRDNDINPAQVGVLNFTGNLNEILQVFPLSDGKVVAHGRLQVSLEEFEEFDQVLRLLPSGDVDRSFTPYTTRGHIGRVAVTSGGNVILVENTSFDEVRVVRLKSDGTLDSDFTAQLPEALGSSPMLAVQGDGKIVLTGEGMIVRLLESGAVDSSFVGARFTTLNGNEASLVFPVVTSSRQLFVHGSFAKVDGVGRPGIARLTANGTLDATFNPAGEYLVLVSFEADGTVLVYNSEFEVVRLTETGTLVGGFTPIEGEDFKVAGGKIYSIRREEPASSSAPPRIWFTRYNSNGTLDTTALPTTVEVDFWSGSVAPRAADEFLVYGNFTVINGQPRMAVANVFVDGATPKVLVSAPVWETEGEVRVPVVRTGTNSEPLTVRYQVEELSAKEGTHFEPATGEIHFAANQSSASFPLRLIDNTNVDRDRLVLVRFTTNAGANISQSPLTILNDDPGFVMSDLHLPWMKTVALRFSGRGTPVLEHTDSLGEWREYQQQPDKREILVPNTQTGQMEFYTFRLE